MPSNQARFSLALPLALCSLLGCSHGATSPVQESAADRQRAIEELGDAGAVLREMVQTREIPFAQCERARCVVVVPAMLRAGLGLGARYGSGVATCRSSKGWSGPVFVTIAGGSAGFQVGVESADLVMLVRSERGMAQLFRSSFQVGGDVSAAAGPKGEAAQASTDATMTAEILSYARSRGLFAGVEVSGAVMKQDRAATYALYGGAADVRAILVGEMPAPGEASGFLEQVRIAFPRADEDHPQQVSLLPRP